MNPFFSTSPRGGGQQSELGTNTHPSQVPPSAGHVSHSGQKQNISVTSNPIQNQELFDFDSIISACSYNPALGANLTNTDYSDPFQSEHTTPQEVIWASKFIDDDSHLDVIDWRSNTSSTMVHVSSPPSASNCTFSPVDKDLPKYISGSQLLSPQLTTPSPPAPDSRRLGQQGTMAIDISPQESESCSTEPTLTTEALNLSQTGGYRMSISPIVIVSSHNAGDSPAWPVVPRARSSSKRSRERSLQEAYETDDDRFSDHNSSRLMPPQPFEADPYAHNGDNRTGQSPFERGSEQVASINELAEQRKIEDRNAGVQDWLSKSETGSVGGDDPNEAAPPGERRGDHRPRAHTTGTRPNPMSLPIYSDHRIPGPGVLLDEPSDDGYSYDDSASLPSSEASSPVPESPPVSQVKLSQQDGPAADQSSFPVFGDVHLSPELEEPLPSQFIRPTPWQDPVQGPITDQQSQPESSNAAVLRFNQEAANCESASRAATWGTRRRLSDSEFNAIVEGSRVRYLSLAKRSSSILTKARGLIPRRSSSNIKKAAFSPSADSEPRQPETPAHREPASPMKALQRIPSFSKPKSPPLNTGSAIMAMSGNLAAVGGGHSGPFTVEPEKSDVFRSPRNVLRKHRSKSDVSKSSTKGSPGLADLMLGHGALPMFKFATPMQERPQLVQKEVVNNVALDDDDDNGVDEVGIRMDLSIRVENIIPTLEGFKIHALKLNPRLQPYLIDRLGQEQVKRYKKLLENKVKHTRSIKVLKTCSSGSHCIGLGGKGTLLPPRVSTKDTESSGPQYQISSPADGELDGSTFEEGVVTPAQFPRGIPLPPVNRLPAEFECILCYKVKKFHKPSDWTKHVHEDIQPFTCTFPNCNEAKSFKRKADWVRHENERHRRLESWKCNVQDCCHTCYRKDNFVQHLVREHKKAEPKGKSRGSGSSKAQANLPDDDIWRLVDSCRHESQTKPQDEPCRFCGNVCNSWKKLSVHLGKHMEQIAMPVLELVSMQEVGPDTSVSPIEQNYVQSSDTIPAPRVVDSVDPQTLSTYVMSAGSTYQGSSAGQSPAAIMPLIPNYPYHPRHLHPAVQPDLMQGTNFDNGALYTNLSNGTYAPSNMTSTNLFGSINPELGSFPTHLQPDVSPNSMPASVPSPQPMPSYAPTQTPYTSSNMHTFAHYTSTSGSGPPLPGQLAPNLDAIHHFGSGHSGSAEYTYETPQITDQPPPGNHADPVFASGIAPFSLEQEPLSCIHTFALHCHFAKISLLPFLTQALYQANLSISHTTGGFAANLGPATEGDDPDSATLEMPPAQNPRRIQDHSTPLFHTHISPSFAATSSFGLNSYVNDSGPQTSTIDSGRSIPFLSENSSSEAKPWDPLGAAGVPEGSSIPAAGPLTDHNTYLSPIKSNGRLSCSFKDSGLGTEERSQYDTQSQLSQPRAEMNSQIPSYYSVPLSPRHEPADVTSRDEEDYQDHTEVDIAPETSTSTRKGIRQSTKNKEELKCEHCGKSIKTPSDMKKHIAGHELPFLCKHPGCVRSNKGFATINDLNRHCKSVHNTLTPGSRSFRQDNFKQHLKRLHPNDNLDELLKRSNDWYNQENHEDPAQSNAQDEPPKSNGDALNAVISSYAFLNASHCTREIQRTWQKSRYWWCSDSSTASPKTTSQGWAEPCSSFKPVSSDSKDVSTTPNIYATDLEDLAALRDQHINFMMMPDQFQPHAGYDLTEEDLLAEIGAGNGTIPGTTPVMDHLPTTPTRRVSDHEPDFCVTPDSDLSHMVRVVLDDYESKQNGIGQLTIAEGSQELRKKLLEILGSDSTRPTGSYTSLYQSSSGEPRHTAKDTKCHICDKMCSGRLLQKIWKQE
ncbi:hypothetical protein DV736_g2448, partial [Chaetothyriales sp. CBS 134916]